MRPNAEWDIDSEPIQAGRIIVKCNQFCSERGEVHAREEGERAKKSKGEEEEIGTKMQGEGRK